MLLEHACEMLGVFESEFMGYFTDRLFDIKYPFLGNKASPRKFVEKLLRFLCDIGQLEIFDFCKYAFEYCFQKRPTCSFLVARFYV